MLFNFELKPPLECAGLESPETRNEYVGWFYLTYSEYYIKLGDVNLFESSPQWIEKYKPEYPSIGRFEDYQYSRQLEDLFEILPTIACPMPEDLYELVETAEKCESLFNSIINIYSDSDDKQEDEKFENIRINLIYYGYLDSSYLRFKTNLKFFNVNGKIIVQYDFIDDDEGCPVWSAGKGTYSLTYKEFVYEIEDLLNRFFIAMDKQVETATRIFNKDVIKKRNLIPEYAQRKDYFYDILNKVKNNDYENQIDWQKLREDLDYFMKQILSTP